MKLVIFLALHIGYITAKSITYSNSCDKAPDDDFRSKRSEEDDSSATEDKAFNNTKDKDKGFTIDNKTEANLEEYEVEHKNNDGVHRSDNLSDLFNLNYTGHLTQVDKKVENNHSVKTTNMYNTQPIIYETIDPKFIITSKLYNPNKKIHVNTKIEPIDVDIKESISIEVTDPKINISKAINLPDLRRDGGADEEGEAAQKTDNETEVTNIRELRQHLLDHLLNYFLNIIKEESYNDTRKKNSKDQIKVEEKLSNYYDPHHLDLLFIEDDDSELDDNDFYPSIFRQKNDKGKDKLDDSEYKVIPKNTTGNQRLALEENVTTTEHIKRHRHSHDFNKAWNLAELEDTPNIESFYEDLTEQSTEIDENKGNGTKSNDYQHDMIYNLTEIVSTTLRTEVATTNTDLTDKIIDDVYSIEDYLYEESASEEYQQLKSTDLKENRRKISDETSKDITDEDQEIIIVNKSNITSQNLNQKSHQEKTLHSNEEITESSEKNDSIQHEKHDLILPVFNKSVSKNTQHLKNTKDNVSYDFGNKMKCIKSIVTNDDTIVKKPSKRRHCKNSILVHLNINLE